MKVAVILAGHSRTYKQTIKSFWTSYRAFNDPDIFCHTWTLDGAFDQLWWAPNGESNLQRTDVNDMIGEYDPMIMCAERSINWPRPENVDDDQALAIQRMRSQWWSPRTALHMIPDFFKYDVVIKTRYDIGYGGLLTDKILEPVVRGASTLFAPYPISIKRNVYSDTVVIATPGWMERYLDYFFQIPRLIEESKVKLGVPGYCSEYGATAYMRENAFWGVEPEYMDIKPYILRANGEMIKLHG